MANRNESYANAQMANAFAAHQDEKARWAQVLGQPSRRAISRPDVTTAYAAMAGAAFAVMAVAAAVTVAVFFVL